MEFGLVCKFSNEPIKFKTYTYKHISKLFNNDEKQLARDKVLNVWDNNVKSLQEVLNYCAENNIKSFRVSSEIFSQYRRIISLGVVTNDDLEYYANKLTKIDSKGVILSMHPGQHVSMGSPNQDVVANSIDSLVQHFYIADKLGIKEINIHAGGVYGDKKAAKKRFIKNMKELLSEEELKMMTLENDELSYSIQDTIEIANNLGIRATLDLHHRAHQSKDKLPLDEQSYFLLARKTWENYSYQRIHLSSPKIGKYTTPSKSRPHSNFVDPSDLPSWLNSYNDLHIDIEAKMKEKAIAELQKTFD